MRYRGFVSYSHSDSKTVARLHRWLESYRLPSRLRMSDGSRRIAPIFRDRDELPTSSDLGTQLVAALESSERLLVFCSPASARSRWVNEEAASFARLGRRDRIIAILIDGDAASADANVCDDERLPSALRVQGVANGTGQRIDLRNGRVHQRGERLRLVAEIAGIEHHILHREDIRRGIRRAGACGILAAGVAMMLAGLGTWALKAASQARRDTAVADHARAEAEVAAEAARKAEAEAVSQERTAAETTEFFVSIFSAFNNAGAAQNALFADLLETACRRLVPVDGSASAVTDAASRSRLLYGLGGALIVLGRKQLADRAMHAAVTDASSSASDGRQDYKVLMTAAVAANDADDHARALALLNQARESRQAAGIAADADDCKIATGRILAMIKLRRSVREIEEQLREAHEILSRLEPRASKHLLVNLLEAEAFLAEELRSDHVLAERTMRKALLACEEADYQGDWSDWPRIALNIVALRQAADTADLADKVIAMYQDRLGNQHPITIRARSLVSNALATFRPEESIRSLEACLDAYSALGAGYARERRWILGSLVNIYVQCGRTAEARPLIEEIRADHQRRSETDRAELAEILELQALFSQRTGDPAVAMQSATQARDIREALGGPLSLDLWDPLFVMSYCHESSGAASLQIATLLRLLAILDAHGLSESDKAVQVHVALSSAYPAPAEFEKKVAHADQAVSICEKSGILGGRYADALGVKGWLLCDLEKRYPEGIGLLVAAVRLCQDRHEIAESFVQKALSALGLAVVRAGTDAALQFELGDQEAAEPILDAVQRGLDELEKQGQLGIAIARDSKLAIAESLVESAGAIVSDDPRAADALARRAEAWLLNDGRTPGPREQELYDTTVRLRNSIREPLR